MPRDAEVALARSAAPPFIAGRATVKVLTATGFPRSPGRVTTASSAW